MNASKIGPSTQARLPLQHLSRPINAMVLSLVATATLAFVPQYMATPSAATTAHAIRVVMGLQKERKTTNVAEAATAVEDLLDTSSSSKVMVAVPSDLFEADPYHAVLPNLPLNTYKNKAPLTATIASVKRIVGLNAPGEVCHIKINSGPTFRYWEGQSLGVIAPGDGASTRRSPANPIPCGSTRSLRHATETTSMARRSRCACAALCTGTRTAVGEQRRAPKRDSLATGGRQPPCSSVATMVVATQADAHINRTTPMLTRVHLSCWQSSHTHSCLYSKVRNERGLAPVDAVTTHEWCAAAGPGPAFAHAKLRGMLVHRCQKWCLTLANLTHWLCGRAAVERQDVSNAIRAHITPGLACCDAATVVEPGQHEIAGSATGFQAVQWAEREGS